MKTSKKSDKSLKNSSMNVNKNETDSGSEEFSSEHSEAEMESAENDISDVDQEKQEDESDISSLNNINKSKMNPGWADAIRKVLSNKKPKRKKSVVLSKAKKHCNTELRECKETLPFEIEITNNSGENVAKIVKKSEEKKSKKKELKTGIRIKPSVLDRERERILQKIATKGVLQLFNAVKHQQIDIDKKLVEAGSLERKREKVLKDIDKKAFLDVLMGGTKSINVDDSAKKLTMQNDTLLEEKNVWKVLRNDFVMGASLKDWDKKTPYEEEN